MFKVTVRNLRARALSRSADVSAACVRACQSLTGDFPPVSAVLAPRPGGAGSVSADRGRVHLTPQPPTSACHGSDELPQGGSRTSSTWGRSLGNAMAFTNKLTSLSVKSEAFEKTFTQSKKTLKHKKILNARHRTQTPHTFNYMYLSCDLPESFINKKKTTR